MTFIDLLICMNQYLDLNSMELLIYIMQCINMTASVKQCVDNFHGITDWHRPKYHEITDLYVTMCRSYILFCLKQCIDMMSLQLLICMKQCIDLNPMEFI